MEIDFRIKLQLMLHSLIRFGRRASVQWRLVNPVADYFSLL